MLITFEGPSAIGKSTLCTHLKTQFYSVPEVNELFKRPKTASNLWYYKKQLSRYSLGLNASTSVIFDGDVFQPLWYNWTYHSKDFNLADALSFYKTEIFKQTLTFPDLYIVFYCDTKRLYFRKTKDFTRKRSNFNKHLQLIPNQYRYFKFLAKHTDVNVVFIPYLDLQTTRSQVLNTINKQQLITNKTINHYQTINQIEAWLTNNKPTAWSTNY
ncbi:hypothetical protein [Formosa sp. A9]|uniref:hypothetical protein n=1 Tax=Formosa sp. A9 TaxID=3442641 RepID=UPI003EBA3977